MISPLFPIPVRVVVGACALIVAGCSSEDPDAPGIETPALTGVVTGEVRTRRQYVDSVEAKNMKNAERGSQGDWRYVRPVVGGDN